MKSKLLCPDKPLLVSPGLASKIGLYEAIILQQIHYWLVDSKHVHDGEYWIYNSIREWEEQFPFICEKTIRTAFKSLEKQGLIRTGNYNETAYDKTKWYTINYDQVPEVDMPRQPVTESKGTDLPDASGKISKSIRQSLPHPSGKSYHIHPAILTEPIPETTTEITPESTGICSAGDVTLPEGVVGETSNPKIDLDRIKSYWVEVWKTTPLESKELNQAILAMLKIVPCDRILAAIEKSKDAEMLKEAKWWSLLWLTKDASRLENVERGMYDKKFEKREKGGAGWKHRADEQDPNMSDEEWAGSMKPVRLDRIKKVQSCAQQGETK